MACETRGAFHSIVAARIGCSRGMLGKIIIMKRWTSSGAVATMAGTSWRDSIVIPAHCKLRHDGLDNADRRIFALAGRGHYWRLRVSRLGHASPSRRLCFRRLPERKGVGSAGSLPWNVAAGLAAFLRKDH